MCGQTCLTALLMTHRPVNVFVKNQALSRDWRQSNGFEISLPTALGRLNLYQNLTYCASPPNCYPANFYTVLFPTRDAYDSKLEECKLLFQDPDLKRRSRSKIALDLLRDDLNTGKGELSVSEPDLFTKSTQRQILNISKTNRRQLLFILHKRSNLITLAVVKIFLSSSPSSPKLQ